VNSDVEQGPVRTELYRHFGADNRLLYVGVALKALIRLTQHCDYSDWFKEIKRVEIEWFESREAALAAEREVIQKEQPLYNVRHKLRHLTRAEYSARELLQHLVTFKPLYKIEDVATVLGVRLSAVRRLIDSKQLSCIWLPNERGGRHRQCRVTGWQLIEFIEAKQQESAVASKPDGNETRFRFVPPANRGCPTG
jgi:predicted GIY-YIG superfamily endonuclease